MPVRMPDAVVLVGTYRKNQLERWVLPRGLYNYPVSEADEALRHAAPDVSELWLYAGKTDRIRFSAAFVREISAAELAALGYPPGKGKSHAEQYLLFRVKPLTEEDGSRGVREEGPMGASKPRSKGDGTIRPVGPRSHILVRLSDFVRSAKVRAKLRKLVSCQPEQIRANGADRRADRKGKGLHVASSSDTNASYFDDLPEDLIERSLGNLCVCEEARQLDFDSLFPIPLFSSRNRVVVQPDRTIPFRLENEPGFENWNAPDGISCSYAAPGGFLFLGDSLRWLRSLPDGCVDMAFADPPYGIGKADWDIFADEESYLDWCDKWIGELSRILSAKGTCYICGFSEILADVKARTKHHFKACRWLVWNYRNKANLGNDWGRSHESILHFRKATATVLNIDDVRIPYGAHTLKYPERTQAETSAFAKSASANGCSWVPNPLGAKPKDVFDIPTTCNGMGEKTPHPTQKPEELLRKLVLASSNPGDRIIDPFSGSGTTLVVAEQLGRRWLGCDLSDEYNKWAESRIRAVRPKSVAEWIAFDRENATRRGSIR